MSKTNTPATPDPKDELIAKLNARLEALEARLGPDPAAVEAPSKDFPRVLYMRGHKKGQIDHPGNVTKIVRSAEQLEAAVAEGWSTEPHPHLDLDEAEELAKEQAKSKAAAKKSKAAA
jgi:hypothetical protein